MGEESYEFCKNCNSLQVFDGVHCTECGRQEGGMNIDFQLTFTTDRRVCGQSYSTEDASSRLRIDANGNISTRKSRSRYNDGVLAIHKIATWLDGLPVDMIDRAKETYRLAVANDFTQGRPIDHVAGVCIYTACRINRHPILLIDISKHLRINVFKLGKLCTKLCKRLGVRLGKVPLLASFDSNEAFDASAYVYRFAKKLEFGKDCQRVSQLAVQVLQKMQNDWIQCGRHPAGLFGACLIIAGQLLGYRRTLNEVARVVYIGGVTISKRVFEFANSTAGGLTLKDFENMDGHGKSDDPPAFKRALLRLKAEEIQENASVQVWIDEGKKAHMGVNVHESDTPLDEDEIDSLILSEEEVKIRTKIFDKMYDQFFIEQEEKKQRRLAEEEKKKNGKKRKSMSDLQRKSKDISRIALLDSTTKNSFTKLHRLSPNSSSKKKLKQPVVGTVLSNSTNSDDDLEWSPIVTPEKTPRKKLKRERFPACDAESPLEKNLKPDELSDRYFSDDDGNASDCQARCPETDDDCNYDSDDDTTFDLKKHLFGEVEEEQYEDEFYAI